METTARHPISTPALPTAIRDFFAHNSTLTTKNTLAHLFKAWASQPIDKRRHTDEEIALFLDQLISLVAAAEQLHQTNRAFITTNPPQTQGDQP